MKTCSCNYITNSNYICNTLAIHLSSKLYTIIKFNLKLLGVVPVPRRGDSHYYMMGGGGPKVKGYLFWEFYMALGHHFLSLCIFLGCEF